MHGDDNKDHELHEKAVTHEAGTGFEETRIEGPQGALLISTHMDGRELPVMFLHSDGGTLHHWDVVRGSLKKWRPTVAIDRRGHGGSSPPRNNSFAPEDAAGDIAATADALAMRRFVLVGHSGGALTAFAFAALYPERLAGLVLVDPPPDPAILPPGLIENTLAAMRGPSYANVVADYYRSIAGGNPEVIARVLEDVQQTRQATIVGCCEALGEFKLGQIAGKYPGPALSIIQPQFDVDGALHRIPPGFPHFKMEGTGHWIHLDAPDRFFSCLNDFLQGLPRSDTSGT